jgi:hypothetical protein
MTHSEIEQRLGSLDVYAPELLVRNSANMGSMQRSRMHDRLRSIKGA